MIAKLPITCHCVKKFKHTKGDYGTHFKTQFLISMIRAATGQNLGEELN